jgi:hypothetical protein
MFRVTKSQWSVNGVQNDYLCSSEEDIAKLPRFGVEGTQEVVTEDDVIVNKPCMYGSTALVIDPALESSKLYILGPDNSWVEFK